MSEQHPEETIALVASDLDCPDLPDELVDELLAGARTPEEITGPDGLLQRLTKRLVERAMAAELSEHLGYAHGQAPPGGVGNSRNGTTPKTIHTQHGSVRVDQPRDRGGSFEPQIVPKHQRRFDGFDERIIAMYGRGMSVRDIQAHLTEIYGVEVGHDLISRVTDAVLEDVREWQARPLEDVYPILFLDALIVKIRDGGAVRNKACYVAVGVNLDGERDVLGLWFQSSEGAKFWLAVLNELRQRGVRDVLICCVDGLKGFPEAIEAVFPHAWVQTCIVHLIRRSLRFVPDKHRRQVAKDLRPIYTAVDADAAAGALAAFETAWSKRYPMIGNTWREAWEHVIPFLAFPSDVRRVVYTTNTIEALHRQIRKTIKTRGHFPTEEAARKLIYLSITNAQKNWRQTYNWTAALLAFKIHFGDRLP
ncbi:MAG TPA: IS256 family transposase [Gaiellales bacterium]|nr:IS256 family transposase [Gaiellales bacterium]